MALIDQKTVVMRETSTWLTNLISDRNRDTYTNVLLFTPTNCFGEL